VVGKLAGAIMFISTIGFPEGISARLQAREVLAWQA